MPTPRSRRPKRPPNRPSKRRALTGLLSLSLLAAGGAGAWYGATRAADVMQVRTGADLDAAFAGADFDWISARPNGLAVELTGTAPDEAARIRALAAAGSVVDPGRIVDQIAVDNRAPPAPPPVKVELLSNGAGVTMMGLVPSDGDRERLIAAVEAVKAGGAGGSGTALTDLVEVSAHPPPDGWKEALSFGAAAIRLAPQAKVSIEPGRVAVTALTDSEASRDRIEAELRRAEPQGLTVSLDIAAPLPVISPFTLRFVRDAGGSRFDACSADTAAARDRIAAAAALPAQDCRIGIGSPSPRWADAVVPAIAAVAAMDAGAVTFTNADLSLQAPATVPQAVFDEAVARLTAGLPPEFRLTADRMMPDSPATVVQPASFTATRAVDGRVTLRGRVPDARMKNAVDSFAQARFPQIDTLLTTDPDLPEGWTVRVIAALEAMTGLASGSATVGPDDIEISGVSGDQAASDRAAQALGRRLGAGAHYRLAIRYDRRLDAALGLPSGEECADRANAVMATSEIGFEPGGAEIAGDVAPVMVALTAALKDCEAFRLEVGGHTDAQGSAGGNLRLSQQRAAAVLAAMTAAGIDTGHVVSTGYGEDRPIATNDTDAGREANRRIEFRLIAPEPVEDAIPEAPPLSGITAAGAADRTDPPAAPSLPQAVPPDLVAAPTGPGPAGDDAAQGSADLTLPSAAGIVPQADQTDAALPEGGLPELAQSQEVRSQTNQSEPDQSDANQPQANQSQAKQFDANRPEAAQRQAAGSTAMPADGAAPDGSQDAGPIDAAQAEAAPTDAGQMVASRPGAHPGGPDPAEARAADAAPTAPRGLVWRDQPRRPDAIDPDARPAVAITAYPGPTVAPARGAGYTDPVGAAPAAVD